MPYVEPVLAAGKKRKRESGKLGCGDLKLKSRKKASNSKDDPQADIFLLETQIFESRRHYNNIATLITTAKDQDGEETISISAAEALYRVFCRLQAAGSFVKRKGIPEAEILIIQWLKERYQGYVDVLVGQFLQGEGPSKQSTALTLLMGLVKAESRELGDYNWGKGPLGKLVVALLLLPEDNSIREEFAENYMKTFDDVRFYTLQVIASYLSNDCNDLTQESIKSNAIFLLSALDTIPVSQDALKNFYGERPTQPRHHLDSITAHKKQAQEAWLGVFRSGLNKEQRKAVLRIFTLQIAPWFLQVEMLMDFLTDSYEVGGATSLLALSGLFYLIQEKNLDYPSFYPKLYSLLDSRLLHSKHRSRFFRLLDTFMSSTHLPAALVASFIKRLSRLALHGPPAGIVAVVPWIYNMFKRHPTCTFMIHRETQDPEKKRELEEEGMDDPFDMEEKDPMETGAIDSSLWEIETLQSHYHPNVATLAKIISEQFTKRSYNLEDFLDHSYSAILDAELGKDLKKTPVVEYEIPKRIFTESETEMGSLGNLMLTVFELN
ncbi:nucleolar complex protein 4 [Lepidopterella palustris CBS 459.81]|uniref:Nucleolar complex protein 4 n=1 Tax=Lepidopterella palustris CBS 459.81 TaxID=1314670 RepID=A0A8E2EAV5_9PEZI|nr:nucleolar complex protein 4 [Lepidopterella palustris CBS 459.81]